MVFHHFYALAFDSSTGLSDRLAGIVLAVISPFRMTMHASS
jgi:hypothetical protein